MDITFRSIQIFDNWYWHIESDSNWILQVCTVITFPSDVCSFVPPWIHPHDESRVPSGVPPTSSTNFLPRYYYLQLTLQHAATHRFIRIEKSFPVGLTQENPCLLAKQTNLLEANAQTKKIGVNGTSLSVVWHTSLWDWRTCVLDFVMRFQKRGFILT